MRSTMVFLASLLIFMSDPCAALWAQSADDSVPLSTATVAADAPDRIAAILAPRREAVLSSEVSERVLAIRKELGEPFGAGGLLVQLDDSTYKVNKLMAATLLESARSDLARIEKLADDKTRQRHAEAVLAAAQANLLATERLYGDNRASHIDLENARRDLTVAQTNRELVDSSSAKELCDARREVAVGSGKLDIATEQLEACTIVGPWSGRVSRVLVNEHELVERGTPVIEVIDDRVLLAKFLLPSSLFRSVQVGQELGMTVVETSETVVVKVSHIAAALDPASVTFEVHGEVDNADGRLRAGMNGSLSLSRITGR